MDTNPLAAGNETEAYPTDEGINRMYAVMYYFAQRVAYDDASEAEVALMARVFDLVDRREDWNVGITDLMV